jgi:DNA-binding response OmpR family regulator
MPAQRSNYCRIVASDDDPKLLAFVVATLRDVGHCVFSAYDAESACELALALDELDLLITNTRLGTTSARELIRAVRRQKPELPILHLGERLPNPDGLLDDVLNLPDPITAETLVNAVQDLLARRKTQK